MFCFDLIQILKKQNKHYTFTISESYVTEHLRQLWISIGKTESRSRFITVFVNFHSNSSLLIFDNSVLNANTFRNVIILVSGHHLKYIKLILNI